MEWRSDGVIVGLRNHGENSAIIEVLTEQKGRHAGVVRGGASRKIAPLLQPGAQVNVEWRARLEEHLGSYHVEPLQSRAHVMSDRLGLAGLTAICSLVCFAFPERMALPGLYDATLDLLDRLSAGDQWLDAYAHWELALLDDLGYGLDLSECAATGDLENLVYVSPKSGRAVSASGAGKWADQLLALPQFLRDGQHTTDVKELIVALNLTGFFLNAWLAPALGNRPLPEARARLLRALERKRDAEL